MESCAFMIGVFYNLGGQLSSVVGEKKYLYKYIDTIGYDMYEQRRYMKYGNGTETNYGYSLDDGIRQVLQRHIQETRFGAGKFAV